MLLNTLLSYSWDGGRESKRMERSSHQYQWAGWEWQGWGLNPGLWSWHVSDFLQGLRAEHGLALDVTLLSFTTQGFRLHEWSVMAGVREQNHFLSWEYFRLPQEKNLSSLTTLYLVAQTVKNLPAVWDTWDPSLAWEDSLKKEMATRSSILAWRIPWILVGCSPWDCRVRHDWATNTPLLQPFSLHSEELASSESERSQPTLILFTFCILFAWSRWAAPFF